MRNINKQDEFSFADDSIAKAYDTILVPSLFEPWALQLIQDNQPWGDTKVLDLACGTGVITRVLANNIKNNGRVIALDINSQMLDLARIRCAEWKNIEFIEGSGESLAISDNTLDVVVCQQGFQFFPNKKTAAIEIHRVLTPGGKAIISTWCPVSECEIFGIICETLEAMNEIEISRTMRIPFDYMTQQQLRKPFKNAGFKNIVVSKQEMNLSLKGGVDGAIALAYATPIGPKLKELSNEKQDKFKKVFIDKIQIISHDGKNFGRMVSNVLKAEK
ncbi:MAG: methyltransferase domain-containing protein [Candidatus Neomarinimicrobiota bacterium]